MNESAFAPAPSLAGAPAPSARRRLLRRHLLAYAALALGAAAMIVPFLWMLSTSLKNDMQAYQFPPIWIPRPAAWENYPNAWNALPFNRFFLNSAFVSLVLTGGQLLTCSLGAFAFARLRDQGCVAKLFTEIGPRYRTRPGGYLRIMKCGYRTGDKAPMAYVELVDRPMPDDLAAGG